MNNIINVALLVVFFVLRHQKYDYANDDQFPPNFDWTSKNIWYVSVPNEVLWTIESRVMGQRSWKIFFCAIWENFLPTNITAAI